jgi:hypothetical protein
MMARTKSPIDVQKFLKGAKYPMEKEALLKLAEKNGADEELMNVIETFPDVDYESPADVQEAFGEADEEVQRSKDAEEEWRKRRPDETDDQWDHRLKGHETPAIKDAREMKHGYDGRGRVRKFGPGERDEYEKRHTPPEEQKVDPETGSHSQRRKDDSGQPTERVELAEERHKRKTWGQHRQARQSRVIAPPGLFHAHRLLNIQPQLFIVRLILDEARIGAIRSRFGTVSNPGRFRFPVNDPIPAIHGIGDLFALLFRQIRGPGRLRHDPQGADAGARPFLVQWIGTECVSVLDELLGPGPILLILAFRPVEFTPAAFGVHFDMVVQRKGVIVPTMVGAIGVQLSDESLDVVGVGWIRTWGISFWNFRHFAPPMPTVAADNMRPSSWACL